MSGDQEDGGRAVRRPRVVRRPVTRPGPLGELKELLYRLYLEAGPPTLEHIADLIAEDDSLPGAPEKDTIARCLGSPDLPANQLDVAAIAIVLAREARWDPDEAAARARALWVQARMNVPTGRPVGEFTDPFALEVHPPVEVAVRPGAPELPVLPAYVPREHDRRLAEVVSRAAGGDSSIAVLVGGSSTGKTRACWEAVHALPSGWRLWHPIFPDRAEGFLAGLERVGPRTVVWLNEAQFYLLTGDPLIGEQVAAGMRDLLRDPARGPVLVLGTIWRRYWQELTGPPAPDGRDPHAQARELLAGAGIEVPGTFTGPALAALAVAARDDPRLAAAEKTGDGQVTQFLAGVPVLLERYRTAPAVARAVIDAALDARALGCGPALPHALLEAATPGYLTDQQWEEDAAEDWLEQALAYTAAPCRGVRGPLTRIRPRPGQPIPSQPHYRLADYLEQTGHTGRRAGSAPASLWNAILAHARWEDLGRLGSVARDRGLYRYAFQLYAAAGALSAVAWMLEEAGRPEEAISFYRQAAEAGDTDALQRAARMLEEAGRAEEAITWLRSRAEAGDAIALSAAAGMLREAGRAEEAITWLRSRAEAGDPTALSAAARMLREAGRVEEAISFYRQAAEAGVTRALLAAEMLQEAGRVEEAISFYRQAAEAGDTYALSKAAGMLREAGRAEEAISFYRQAAEAGDDTGALNKAAGMLWDAGRVEEAITWVRSRAEAGATYALLVAAGMLEEAGRAEEAISFYQQAAEAGVTYALLAAEMLQEAGRAEEAISFYRQAAEAGDTYALSKAAGMLREAGRAEEAISFYRQAAEAGDTRALRAAAGMLWKAGRMDEAISFYQQAAEAGDPIAWSEAAAGMLRKGRADEAITWLLSRAEAGAPKALSEAAAAMLRKAGRAEEVISFYQQAAEAGDTYALAGAAWMLRKAGRAEEAITWLRSRAEAGDTFALSVAAGMLQEAGRPEEAISLYRQAAEAGHTGALSKAAGMLREAGRPEEAISFYRQAAQAGDTRALSAAAGMLQEAGRAGEAISLYRQAAEAGHTGALSKAAGMLQEAGRAEEAARLRRYGIEPGGRTADPWNANVRA